MILESLKKDVSLLTLRFLEIYDMQAIKNIPQKESLKNALNSFFDSSSKLINESAEEGANTFHIKDISISLTGILTNSEKGEMLNSDFELVKRAIKLSDKLDLGNDLSKINFR